MASVIDQAIPDQAFEILRDRIGLILAEELAVQYVLKSLPGTTPKVFVERFAQIDATECPVINVMLDRGDYDNQDPTTARGTFNFSVDVYTTAASKTGGVRGDAASVIGLHKLMGICRAIIQDARYIRLGFDPGFVMRRQVTSIQIADQTKSKDVNNAVMGRLNVLVAAPEVSGFDTALAIGGFDTQVKLHSTELGYVFSGDDFPAPPITGSEIKVNGALLIDLQCGNLLDIALVNSDGDEIGQIIDSETVLVGDSTVNLINSNSDQIGSASVAAEQTVPKLVPDGSAKNSLGNVVADVPAGGEANVDDSLLSINSSPYLALPATVNRNIEIQYDDDTPVGTVDEEGIVRIPNQATFDNPEVWFNGIKVAEPASGETWFQIVKVNGEFPDSVEWDSPNANFNLIKADGDASLTIGVFSDAGLTTPVTSGNNGSTVYIKANPTGITPTSYTFSIDGSKDKVVTQAGDTYAWTIDIVGAVVITARATDGSGATANATAFAFTANLIIDKAISFDGVNDYTYSWFVPKQNTSFSVTMRVKMNNTALITPMFSINEVGAQRDSFCICFSPTGNVITVHSWNGSWDLYTIGSITPDTNWHHLTVTFNSATNHVKAYWDGVLIGTRTSAANYGHQKWQLFALARAHEVPYVGGKYGNMTIADPAIHDVTLTQVQVTALQTLGAVSGNEVQHYPVTEAIGTTTGYIADMAGTIPMQLINITSPNGVKAYP